MIIPDQYTELPTYFASGAFANTRIEHSGIYYDTDVLGALSDFLDSESGRKLAEDLSDTAFVYRFGEPGYQRPEPDPNYHKANPSTLYVSAGQLALAPGLEVTYSTKAEIQAIGRQVAQVQLKNGEIPSAAALASSVLYPPAEDHRLKASPGAWMRQFVEAFTPHASTPNRERIIQEVAARYAGAILLARRRPLVGRPQ